MSSNTNSPLLNYLLTSEPSFRKARLAALYSDFQQLQSLNPDGYHANIETWRKGLASACRAGVLPTNSLLTIQLDEPLLRSLETKEWGRPLALGIVIDDAVARKEMMGVREFLAVKESIYTKRWDISPWSVLGWGLKQLGWGGPGNRLPMGKLVVVSNLEEAGREFQGRTVETRGKAERIYSRRSFMEEFRDLLGEKALPEPDFDILLRYLERDKGLVVYDGETVKLLAAGEEKRITEEDSTVASLQILISDLEIQVKVLEAKVEAAMDTAKEAVSKNRTASAKAALKSKKIAETTLEKRHAVLTQLEEVYAKIEQANDQVELVRIMESSSQVLAGLNKKVGGVERVDSVVDMLREQMGEVNEVGEVLAEQGREGVDDTEVDEELEAMERVETEKRETAERKTREEQERKEAEETRRKLAELEAVEKKAREKAEAEREKETSENLVEVALRKSTDDLKKMTLDAPQQELA